MFPHNFKPVRNNKLRPEEAKIVFESRKAPSKVGREVLGLILGHKDTTHISRAIVNDAFESLNQDLETETKQRPNVKKQFHSAMIELSQAEKEFTQHNNPWRRTKTRKKKPSRLRHRSISSLNLQLSQVSGDPHENKVPKSSRYYAGISKKPIKPQRSKKTNLGQKALAWLIDPKRLKLQAAKQKVQKAKEHVQLAKEHSLNIMPIARYLSIPDPSHHADHTRPLGKAIQATWIGLRFPLEAFLIARDKAGADLLLRYSGLSKPWQQGAFRTDSLITHLALAHRNSLKTKASILQHLDARLYFDDKHPLQEGQLLNKADLKENVVPWSTPDELNIIIRSQNRALDKAGNSKLSKKYRLSELEAERLIESAPHITEKVAYSSQEDYADRFLSWQQDRPSQYIDTIAAIRAGADSNGPSALSGLTAIKNTMRDTNAKITLRQLKPFHQAGSSLFLSKPGSSLLEATPNTKNQEGAIVAKELFQVGLNPNEVDHDRHSPMPVLARILVKPNAAVVKAFLDSGANPNVEFILNETASSMQVINLEKHTVASYGNKLLAHFKKRALKNPQDAEAKQDLANLTEIQKLFATHKAEKQSSASRS